VIDVVLAGFIDIVPTGLLDSMTGVEAVRFGIFLNEIFAQVAFSAHKNNSLIE
jgi:hypothetical protein